MEKVGKYHDEQPITTKTITDSCQILIVKLTIPSQLKRFFKISALVKVQFFNFN